MWVNPPHIRMIRRQTNGKWATFLHYMRVASYLPLALLGFGLLLGILRFMVIFLETFEIVRGERDADVELLELCASGVARTSPKMQSACMQASAARASPLLVSAFIRSVSTFLQDLWGLVAQPVQSLTGLGLVTIMGLTPWLGPLKALLLSRPAAQTGEADFRDDHVVVLTEGPYDENCSMLSLRQRGLPSRLLGEQSYLEEAGVKSGFQRGGQVDDSGFEEVSLHSPNSPVRGEPTLFGYSNGFGASGRLKAD